jgi:hypothetical protein
MLYNKKTNNKIMRKDPIQKKAKRKAEQQKFRKEREMREEKMRKLQGIEPKSASQRRVAKILNEISTRKAS